VTVAPSRREAKRRSRRANAFRIALAGIFFAVVALGVAAIYAGLIVQAKASLERAAIGASSLKLHVSERDFAQADVDRGEIVSAVQSAETVTRSLPWRFASGLPIVGDNFSVVTDLTRELALLSGDFASTALGVLQDMVQNPIIDSSGRISIDRVTTCEQQLGGFRDQLSEALATLKNEPQALLLPQVSRARSEFLDLLEPAVSLVAVTNELAPITGKLLGAEGTRSYLVMFQNPAEMRPQGGLPGAFSLLTISNGKITLQRQTSGSKRVFGTYENGIIPIDPGRLSLFPESTLLMANTTSTPSFSEAARKTSAFWENAGYGTVDGVLSLDPTALSYLLESTGPVSLSNSVVLDPTTVVSYLMNGNYLYSDDPVEQDALYQEAVGKVFEKVESGHLKTEKLIGAIEKATAANRLALWLSDSEEQKVLGGLGHGLEPPTISDAKAGVSLLFEDNQGSKMDFYLTQDATVASAMCQSVQGQRVRVTYTLRNTLPVELIGKLPTSVWGTSSTYIKVAGGIRANTYLYLPPGATVTGATVDGEAVRPDVRQDSQNPVVKTHSEIAPQTSTTIAVEYLLPEGTFRDIELEVTPLVNSTTISNEPLACS
jgi:hypothetical protein